MKRALLALIAAFLLFFCACASGSPVLSENSGGIISIKATDIETGAAVIVPEEYFAACSEFIEKLSCEYEDYCSEGDKHKYLLEIETRAGPENPIYLNSDGTVCKNGLLRRAVGGRGFKYDLSVWEALFSNNTEAAAYEEPEEEGVWLPDYLSAEKGQPIKAPRATRWKSCEPLLEVGDWSYINGIIELDGVKYSVAARESKGRVVEIIFGAEQISPQRCAMSYLWGSYQKSGGFLYYSVTRSDGNCSVYRFDTAGGNFVLLLDGPCSNLLLPDSPKAGYENTAWVITADQIASLDLTTGTINTEHSASISELTGLSKINHSFTQNPSGGYDQKYAAISEVDGGNILITVIECPQGRPEAGKMYQFIYDPYNKTIYQE
ncbi:MAG: hypothetical protein ACOX7P_10425 [Oscillospiraceae bacterium]|jgi:hypothetical protein